MPWTSGNWGPEAKAKSLLRRAYFREYAKQRYAEKKLKILTANDEWEKENPEKSKAEAISRYKVKIPKGQLCEDCHQNPATQKHHPDYSKPFEVKFLCASCHRKTRNYVTWKRPVPKIDLNNEIVKNALVKRKGIKIARTLRTIELRNSGLGYLKIANKMQEEHYKTSETTVKRDLRFVGVKPL